MGPHQWSLELCTMLHRLHATSTLPHLDDLDAYLRAKGAEQPCGGRSLLQQQQHYLLRTCRVCPLGSRPQWSAATATSQP